MPKNAGAACNCVGECGLAMLMPVSVNSQGDVEKAVKERSDFEHN
jgi:hypothetical protein